MLEFKFDSDGKINALIFNLSNTDSVFENRIKNDKKYKSRNTTGMFYFSGKKNKYRKDAEDFVHNNGPFIFNKEKTLKFLEELIILFDNPDYLYIKPDLKIDVFKMMTDLLSGKEISFEYEIDKYLKYEKNSKEAPYFKKLIYGDFTQVNLQSGEIFLSLNHEIAKTHSQISIKNSSEEEMLDEISNSLEEKIILSTSEEKVKLKKVNQLLKICRPNNFRALIIEAAMGVSEIESEHSFDDELPFLEAAHIISVKEIVKYINKELELTKSISQEALKNIEFLTSSANGILIPFHYHKLFDKGIIKFNTSERKFVAVKPKREEIVEYYGISKTHKLSDECFKRVEKAFKYLENK